VDVLFLEPVQPWSAGLRRCSRFPPGTELAKKCCCYRPMGTMIQVKLPLIILVFPCRQGARPMRSNLFWPSDEQWPRIGPHLPTDGLHHVYANGPSNRIWNVRPAAPEGPCVPATLGVTAPRLRQTAGRGRGSSPPHALARSCVECHRSRHR